MAKNERSSDFLNALLNPGSGGGGGYAYSRGGKTVFSATGIGINTKKYKKDENTYLGTNAPDGGKGGWTISGYKSWSGSNPKGGGSVNRSMPIWKRVDGDGKGRNKAKNRDDNNQPTAPTNTNNGTNTGTTRPSSASTNTNLQDALARVEAWNNARRGLGPNPGASMPRTQSNFPSVLRSSPHLRSAGEGASNLYAGMYEEGMGRLDNSRELAQEYHDRAELTTLQSKQDLHDRIANYRGTIPDYIDPFAKGSYRPDGKSKKSLWDFLEGQIT